MKNIDKNRRSLGGEFAVLSQLHLQGFDASLSLGNTKGVDLFVSSPNNEKEMYRVEVKTTFNPSRKISKSKDFGEVVDIWVLNKKNELIDDDKLIYCFVSVDQTKPNEGNIFYYIVPNEVVKKYLKAESDFWFNKEKRNVTKTSDMRHFRLGIKGCEYNVPTPYAEDYKNNWGLFK